MLFSAGSFARERRDWVLALVLIVAITLPFVSAVRLATAPVFIYRPPGSSLRRPLELDPASGPRLAFGGPFYQLQPGEYIAAFRLAAAGPQGAGAAGRIEVLVYSASGLERFTREVPASALGAGGHDESIRFRVDLASPVETRMFFYAKSPMRAEAVRVWPARNGGRIFSIPLIALAAAGLLASALLPGRMVWLMKLWFVSIAAASIICAGHSVKALNYAWLLAPAAIVPVLLVAGGALLRIVDSGVGDKWSARVSRTDSVSDGAATLLLVVFAGNLDAFSLAAIASAAWATKGMLALLLLASPGRRRSLTGAVAIAAYTYLGLILWYHQYPLSGDQLSYTVEASTLVRHGSVNTWKTLDSGEFREFAPYKSTEDLAGDTLTVRGIPGWPARDLGISLLAAPAYLAGKVTGERIAIALCGIALAGILFAVLRRVPVRAGPAAVAWALTCFSLPMLHFASVVYPEIAGAALTITGLWALGDRPAKGRMLVAGVAIGLLPWFNARFWLIALPLLALGIAKIFRLRSWPALCSLLLPPALLTAAAIWVNASTYGIALPNACYWLMKQNVNPRIYNQASPVSPRFYVGWAGILLDRHWGLLATAPAFLLAIAGAPALWRRSRSLALQCAALVLPYSFAVASLPFWQGGPTPTPRYLVAILPVLAIPMAALLDDLRAALRWPVVGVAAAVSVLTAIAGVTSFDADYNGARLMSRCIDMFSVPASRFLPPIDGGRLDTLAVLLTAGWIAAGGFLIYASWRGSRQRAAGFAERSPFRAIGPS